jgi:hypothetical protein
MVMHGGHFDISGGQADQSSDSPQRSEVAGRHRYRRHGHGDTGARHSPRAADKKCLENCVQWP